MRVELRHRDQGGWSKRHFIDVLVELSEIEKRIVNVRALHKTQLDLTPGILASSTFPIPRWIAYALYMLTPLMFLAGCVGSCTASTVAHSNPTPFALLAVAGFLLFCFAIYVQIRSGRERSYITIDDLFVVPRFSILVPDPAQMTQAEMVFKQRVYELKYLLDSAAEKPKEVIEL